MNIATPFTTLPQSKELYGEGSSAYDWCKYMNETCFQAAPVQIPKHLKESLLTRRAWQSYRQGVQARSADPFDSIENRAAYIGMSVSDYQEMTARDREKHR